jgi:mannose-1-phosphate guanylyltransferase
MKAVIFAGGVGTRLWPLSRKKSPKQFEKLVDDKSTLQLTVERLFPEFKPSDIYIATGESYVHTVKNQLPMIPSENIMGEPSMQDNGPAVALIMGYLAKKNPNEPVLILWSDHLVKHEHKFKQIVQVVGKEVEKHPQKIIFIGQKPRFASENLGWIEVGTVEKAVENVNFQTFEGFKYRPGKEVAEQYFKDKKYCWNLGYFITSPGFMYSLFKQFSKDIHSLTERILNETNFPSSSLEFTETYAKMPKINLDNAVLESLDKKYASVVTDDIGWSDVGAWEALKEALEKSETDNITKGNVLIESCEDNLIYNYQEGALVLGVDLDDMIVINTGDVILVARKNSVSKIKKLVESFQGTEHEKLT